MPPLNMIMRDRQIAGLETELAPGNFRRLERELAIKPIVFSGLICDQNKKGKGGML